MTLIERADKFAEYHHSAVGQKRKYTGEDYIVHPRAVAAKMIEIVPEATDEMIVAALLHDTIEDTNATADDIRLEFGEEILEYVLGLTDVATRSDGNRAARRKINDEHTASGGYVVQTVKVFDIANNIESIADHDVNFGRVYFFEKKATMLGLLKADHRALKYLAEILDSTHNKLFSD